MCLYIDIKLSRPGVPNLWAADRYRSRPVRNQAAQQEVSLNVICLYYPQTSPHPGRWKNCLPWNQSLVPKRLGTAALDELLSS